ncbi:MAG: hypothetical protein JWR00_994, partial [Rubritepida sp.]|nr:hypothetical protein [Rubritepida sp.]
VQDGPLLVVLEPSGDGRLDAAHARLMQALIEQEAADQAAEEAERKVNAAQKAVDRAQAAWEEKRKPAPAHRQRAPKTTRPATG